MPNDINNLSDRVDLLESTVNTIVSDSRLRDEKFVKVASTVDKIYEILSGDLQKNGLSHDVRDLGKQYIILQMEVGASKTGLEKLQKDFDTYRNTEETKKDTQLKTWKILAACGAPLWAGVLWLVKKAFILP